MAMAVANIVTNVVIKLQVIFLIDNRLIITTDHLVYKSLYEVYKFDATLSSLAGSCQDGMENKSSKQVGTEGATEGKQ